MKPTTGDVALQPLAGFSVVLTADRRAAEWTASLTSQGADVVGAPVLRIEPIGSGRDLVRATLDVIDDPPDDVLVTTAIGLRGWVEAADAVGLAPALLDVLARARVLARGPKARGAALALGLETAADAGLGQTSMQLADFLIAEGVRGRRVTVQQHGAYDEKLLTRLARAGASVRSVPVYRWGPAPDPGAVERAIGVVCAGSVDAVIFVSAPGSTAFLDAARRAGRYEETVAALRDGVVSAAVGPMTAAPLRAAGISAIVPDHYRLGALVRILGDHLVADRVARVQLSDGAVLELRGRMVLLDGCRLSLSPGPLAVLRTLARHPGEVVDRERLLGVLPGSGQDGHAVEVTVGRLRTSLGRPGVVQTVVKRGYRLAVPLA